MKKFEFFSELNVLNESKIFQSPSNVSKYTYRNILDYTFLYLVIFQILRDEPEFSDFVQKYVRDVLKHGNNFNYYKRTQNDFYHFMHILIGRFNDDVVENLKPSNDKNLLIKNQRIQLNEIISYLNNIRYGRPRQESIENRFFLKLESDFLITNSNFRSIRRLVRDWEDKDYEQRSFVITRILLELRNKLFRSELLKPLEELSKKFRYELPVELKEAKKDSVAGRDFWINPTASEVEKLIQNFGDLRGMIIDERTLVWKAYDITHADMLAQLRRYKITDKDFDLLLYFSESKDTQAYEWINNVRPGRRDYVIGYFNGFDFNLKSVSTAAKNQLNKLVEINLHESRIRKIDEKLQHSLDSDEAFELIKNNCSDILNLMVSKSFFLKRTRGLYSEISDSTLIFKGKPTAGRKPVDTKKFIQVMFDQYLKDNNFHNLRRSNAIFTDIKDLTFLDTFYSKTSKPGSIPYVIFPYNNSEYLFDPNVHDFTVKLRSGIKYDLKDFYQDDHVEKLLDLDNTDSVPNSKLPNIKKIIYSNFDKFNWQYNIQNVKTPYDYEVLFHGDYIAVALVEENKELLNRIGIELLHFEKTLDGLRRKFLPPDDIKLKESKEKLPEEINRFIKLWPKIEKHCSDIIDIYKKNNGKLLYRGSRHLPDEIFIKSSREDRFPKHSDLRDQKIIDNWLKEKGFTARRHNSFFVASKWRDAYRYASPGLHIVFPVNGFNYTWGEIDDLYAETKDDIENIDNINDYPDVISKNLHNFWNEYLSSKNIKNTNLEDVWKRTTDVGESKLLDSTEVLIKGKCIFIPDDYEKIIKQLLKNEISISDLKNRINEHGVGKIVKGINTTDDVKPGETKRQAKKFGFNINKNNEPPKLTEIDVKPGEKREYDRLSSVWPDIEKYCSQILKYYKQYDKYISRGVSSTKTLIYVSKSREDRQSLSFSMDTQRKIDSLLKDNGAIALRSNSIFTYVLKPRFVGMSKMYGQQYIIFPFDNFNYTYLKKIRKGSQTIEYVNDLFGELSTISVTELENWFDEKIIVKANSDLNELFKNTEIEGAELILNGRFFAVHHDFLPYIRKNLGYK